MSALQGPEPVREGSKLNPDRQMAGIYHVLIFLTALALLNNCLLPEYRLLFWEAVWAAARMAPAQTDFPFLLTLLKSISISQFHSLFPNIISSLLPDS